MMHQRWSALDRLRGVALAGMLMFVAIQHALLAMRLEGRLNLAIAAGVGLVLLSSGNLAIGFAFGVVVLVLRHLRERWVADHERLARA